MKESKILVATPVLHPNWTRYDERNGGRCSVYVLRFEDNGFYVGHTGKPVAQRVAEHQAGLTKLTRGRPVKDLVYTQEVTTRELALQLEHSVGKLLETLGYRVTYR